MAATTISAVWLGILSHTVNAQSVTPGQVRTFCPQHKVGTDLLPRMVNSGYLFATAQGKYYIDGTCLVPPKIPLNILREATIARSLLERKFP